MLVCVVLVCKMAVLQVYKAVIHDTGVLVPQRDEKTLGWNGVFVVRWLQMVSLIQNCCGFFCEWHSRECFRMASQIQHLCGFGFLENDFEWCPEFPRAFTMALNFRHPA